MQSTITIPDVQISFAEFQRLHQRILLHRRWWIVWFFRLFPLAGGWWLASQLPIPIIYQIGIGGGFAALVWWGTRREVRKKLRVQYDSSAIFRHPVTYTLDEGGIHSSSPALQTVVAWSHFHHATMYELNWLYLSTNGVTGIYLDTTRIQPPASLADVQTLLQHHGIVVS